MSLSLRLSLQTQLPALRSQLIQLRSSSITKTCCFTSVVSGSHEDDWASPFAGGSFTSSISQQRKFTSTIQRLKKAKHEDSESPTNPLDVTSLKAKVDEAIEKLRTDLSKLRGGGRFDFAVVEQLRVQPQKGVKGTVKLGTLAQVIPKSRFLNVVVGDPEHVKPVSSAIAASNHSLVPQQPTADAPTTIIVPIPPPTGDARKVTLASARKAADGASTAVKMARQQHHKMLRNLQLERKLRPDDFKKANSIMEKVIETANKSVKTIRDNAKSALESS